jgi:hypothetical protein
VSDDAPSAWDRLGDPWTTGPAGVVLFGAPGYGRPHPRPPLALLYPVALVGAGLLLARRACDSPVAHAGCAGPVLVGFVVYLVGR